MWYLSAICRLGVQQDIQYYAIRSVAEARAYLRHPVLRPRLIEFAEAVLAIEGRLAHEIFGSPDDLKLRSCVTLFASVSEPASVFYRLLESYFDGEPDSKTLKRLNTTHRV